ncbi:calmodulin-binding protein-like protein [Tasmannia lanceolata]|uniref:calmodulin-binding protein-like protein n=1 Tax=Tasmannia lanceolata TaxID=3420 RepID=UPI0040633318
MASHHHHQHNHNHHPSPPCYCCCCCCSSHPSPPPPTTDPLLQALATHLLQIQTPPSHIYLQSPKPPQHYSHPHPLKPQQNPNPNPPKQQTQQTLTLTHSLLRRVTALESSLLHLSSSSPSSTPSLSLRDLAAKTIQTHFRSFLARRSQTLRDLRTLASIKSGLSTLKSSLSDQTHLKSGSLSQKAADLVHRLDSIQSRDSMIREGKKSISTELVKFLEFLNGVLVKRIELSSKSLKKVRFAENGKESRVYVGSQEQFPDYCEVYDDDQSAFVEKLSSEIERIESLSGGFETDEETHVELEGFHQISSDDERNIGKNIKAELFHSENGNLGLFAPMPVQMEPRTDKKKIVRVVRS